MVAATCRDRSVRIEPLTRTCRSVMTTPTPGSSEAPIASRAEDSTEQSDASTTTRSAALPTPIVLPSTPNARAPWPEPIPQPCSGVMSVIEQMSGPHISRSPHWRQRPSTRSRRSTDPRPRGLDGHGDRRFDRPATPSLPGTHRPGRPSSSPTRVGRRSTSPRRKWFPRSMHSRGRSTSESRRMEPSLSCRSARSPLSTAAPGCSRAFGPSRCLRSVFLWCSPTEWSRWRPLTTSSRCTPSPVAAWSRRPGTATALLSSRARSTPNPTGCGPCQPTTRSVGRRETRWWTASTSVRHPMSVQFL
jgi:hypothetical protein